MLAGIVVTILVFALVAGPLAWRVWRDRAERRALDVHADVDSVIRRALGGESLLSIRVRSAAPWRRGRIVLETPRRWEWLVEAVVAPVLARIPADYDLVVPATGPAPAVPETRQLKAAA